MPDIRLKPNIRTVISLPSYGERRGTNAPNPQKERGDGGSIVWRTLEYPYAEKGRDWFLSIGIVALALAVAAFILSNILFGLLILISTSTLFLFALRRPTEIRCELNKNGFFVERTRYVYADLTSFWIDEHRGVPVLHARTKSVLSPYLNIPLRKEDAGKIRGFLGKRVKEEEFNEPFSHQIAEMVGL